MPPGRYAPAYDPTLYDEYGNLIPPPDAFAYDPSGGTMGETVNTTAIPPPPAQPSYVPTDLGYDASYDVPPPDQYTGGGASTYYGGADSAYQQGQAGPNANEVATLYPDTGEAGYRTIPAPSYTGGAWSPTDTMRPSNGNWVGPFNMDEWGRRIGDFLTAGVPAGGSPAAGLWTDPALSEGVSWDALRDPGSWLPEPQQQYDVNGRRISGRGEALFLSGPAGRFGKGPNAPLSTAAGDSYASRIAAAEAAAAARRAGRGTAAERIPPPGGTTPSEGTTFAIPPPAAAEADIAAAASRRAMTEGERMAARRAAADTAAQEAAAASLQSRAGVGTGGRGATIPAPTAAPIPSPGAGAGGVPARGGLSPRAGLGLLGGLAGAGVLAGQYLAGQGGSDPASVPTQGTPTPGRQPASGAALGPDETQTAWPVTVDAEGNTVDIQLIMKGETPIAVIDPETGERKPINLDTMSQDEVNALFADVAARTPKAAAATETVAPASPIVMSETIPEPASTSTRESRGGSRSRDYESDGYTSRSSRSSTSRRRKGKKGDRSSSMFGEGWPFNRPNTPMRDFILAALAESMANGRKR